MFIFVLISLLVLCLVCSNRSAESFVSNSDSNIFDNAGKTLEEGITEEVRKLNTANPNPNLNLLMKAIIDQFNASAIKNIIDPKSSMYTDGSFDREADLFLNIDENSKATINTILTNAIVVLEKLKSKCSPQATSNY